MAAVLSPAAVASAPKSRTFAISANRCAIVRGAVDVAARTVVESEGFAGEKAASGIANAAGIFTFVAGLSSLGLPSKALCNVCPIGSMGGASANRGPETHRTPGQPAEALRKDES